MNLSITEVYEVVVALVVVVEEEEVVGRCIPLPSILFSCGGRQNSYSPINNNNNCHVFF